MSKENHSKVELDNSWYKCPVCGTWNDVSCMFEDLCVPDMDWLTEFKTICIKCSNMVLVTARLIPTFSIKDSQGKPIKSVCENKKEYEHRRVNE